MVTGGAPLVAGRGSGKGVGVAEKKVGEEKTNWG